MFSKRKSIPLISAGGKKQKIFFVTPLGPRSAGLSHDIKRTGSIHYANRKSCNKPNFYHKHGTR